VKCSVNFNQLAVAHFAVFQVVVCANEDVPKEEVSEVETPNNMYALFFASTVISL
jgi:hypothetical protein